MLIDSEVLFAKEISLAVLAILIIQSNACGEILTTTQEKVIFDGNLTLVVEDVDPVSDVVWLKLSDENGTLKSEVCRVGERFAYEEDEIELTITRIYAGDVLDLVAFEVNRGEISKSPTHDLSDADEKQQVPERSPGFDIIPVGIWALVATGRRFLRMH
jgi:hypothetical protein